MSGKELKSVVQLLLAKRDICDEMMLMVNGRIMCVRRHDRDTVRQLRCCDEPGL
jgi:hypothetical protein